MQIIQTEKKNILVLLERIHGIFFSHFAVTFFLSFFFYGHFSCDLYGWKNVNIRDRTQTRHLSFPRFYSRRLILNRRSQGRLRNPARHCKDANQFSSRGSFSRSFHRAGTKCKGRRGKEKGQTHVHRIERMCAQICERCRLYGWLSPPPFLLLYLLVIFFLICNLHLSLIGDIEKKKIVFHKNEFNAREKLLFL